MTDLKKTLLLLDREYRARTPQNAPPKTCMVMRSDRHGVCQYTNVLTARLTNGFIATKVITVDEDRSHTDAVITLVDPDSRVLWTKPAIFLTNLRCAFMAALATQRFFKSVSPDLTVGLIGAGEMNVVTARLFAELFGITTFRVKTSKRNPQKNLARFPAGTLMSPDPLVLATCDVVISATNVESTAESIGYEDVTLGQQTTPRLFIAQDGGWMLDQSFRILLPTFTDDVAQIKQHLEDEFPDTCGEARFRLETIEDLTSFRFNPETSREAAVYLYGIGTADAVVGYAHGNELDALRRMLG